MANASLNDGGTLVLGGTGKTGRRIADRLRRAGRTVRIGSRAGAPPFDWEKPDTWGPALQGVKAAYIPYLPDVGRAGALDNLQAFFAQAIGAGVTKLVFLSARGYPQWQQAERALQATGADWTILPSSWFSQNFSEYWLLDSILAGELKLPRGLAADPFVDVDDIADVAFAALTESRHTHQTYELTGPRALTFGEAVGEIARAVGRDIAFIEVSPAEYRAELVGQGVPPEYVDVTMEAFSTLDGRNTPVRDGVERALGHSPRDFSDYARRAAATGVWKDDRA